MKNKLEDYKINIRIKLSALWTAVMFCYIYGDYFELYVPKKVEELLNGQNMLDSPIKLLITTIILAIPALMIFFFINFKCKINKVVKYCCWNILHTLYIACRNLIHNRMESVLCLSFFYRKHINNNSCFYGLDLAKIENRIIMQITISIN